MVIDIDSRNTSCIDFRFVISFVLLFKEQWHEDNIWIQRDNLFNVKCFIIYVPDERNFFQFWNIRFIAIPHIGTQFAQIWVHTNNSLSYIFTLQCSHSQERTTGSTQLYYYAFSRFFQCHLLTSYVCNLNRFTSLSCILFCIPRTTTSRHNHAHNQ